MPVEIQTVSTGAFTMDYFRFGRGKETLVILPGLSVQSVMGLADAVAEAYQAFTDDYTIYLFDRRRELPPKYSVYDMARDTAEAFRALGLNGVNLLGVSQGGMIAMKMAIDHPGLIRKLALGSTSACVGEGQYQVIGEWVRLARSKDATGLYLSFGEAIYSRDVFERSRALLTEAAESVTDEDLRRFIILAEGMKGFDVTGNLEKIACPALVIGSRDDRVLGAEASERIMERLTARAELYMYDGYGHAAYDTAPDYKERIQSFLEPARAAHPEGRQIHGV